MFGSLPLLPFGVHRGGRSTLSDARRCAEHDVEEGGSDGAPEGLQEMPPLRARHRDRRGWTEFPVERCVPPLGLGPVLRYVPAQLLHVQGQPTRRACHRPRTRAGAPRSTLDLADVGSRTPRDPSHLSQDLAQDPVDQPSDPCNRLWSRFATQRHVNSTSEGGGVAELLHQLLGYLVEGGIRCRWAVVEGDQDFFRRFGRRAGRRLRRGPLRTSRGGTVGPVSRAGCPIGSRVPPLKEHPSRFADDDRNE